jgi:hypothetical protein
MCIFVVLCVDEAYYFMCEYSAAIKLPKSYSPPPHQKKEYNSMITSREREKEDNCLCY